jgi:hypothetical protein
VSDPGRTKLSLRQPSLRREWQLRRGDDVAATLWIPLFRRGASAEVAGRRLAIERQGSIRSEFLVRDETTQEQLARLRPDGRRRVLELADRTAEWKRLGRKEGYGFVGADGEPFLRAKVASGLFHTNGEVEIAGDVPEQDALVLALLASYLVIRKAEDDASAAAASTTAATSSSS